MKTQKLKPESTNPDFVDIEVIEAADGGLCLAIGNRRVAGCKPSLNSNNVKYRWNVRTEELKQDIDNIYKCFTEELEDCKTPEVCRQVTFFVVYKNAFASFIGNHMYEIAMEEVNNILDTHKDKVTVVSEMPGVLKVVVQADAEKAVYDELKKLPSWRVTTEGAAEMEAIKTKFRTKWLSILDFESE